MWIWFELCIKDGVVGVVIEIDGFGGEESLGRYDGGSGDWVWFWRVEIEGDSRFGVDDEGSVGWWVGWSWGLLVWIVILLLFIEVVCEMRLGMCSLWFFKNWMFFDMRIVFVVGL